MNKITAFIVGLLALGLSSCDIINGPVACTDQFVSIAVEVVGDSLTQTYTIRDDKDTVFSFTNSTFDSFYTIIDDSYLEELENDEDNFLFHGYIGDSLVVNEAYQLGADRCHVYKVSGKERIEL